jgi:hypothetical protein
MNQDLVVKIQDAITNPNITKFRTTFQEIFTNPFFTVCVKPMGRVAYIISGLSCLRIFPVVITVTSSHAQLHENKEVDDAISAFNVQEDLWTDEEDEEDEEGRQPAKYFKSDPQEPHGRRPRPSPA